MTRRFPARGKYGGALSVMRDVATSFAGTDIYRGTDLSKTAP